LIQKTENDGRLEGAGTDKSLLSDEEIKKLIVIGCSPDGASYEQIHWFIRQCEEMRARALFLEAILSGLFDVTNITENNFYCARRKTPLAHLEDLDRRAPEWP
jgi:hypothetical protein